MLADRIRCDGQRLHLEQWLNRNDRTRATVSAHTTKSRKDQTNTNTLTRCRSLELLEDDHNRVPNMRTDSSSIGLTRSYDILNTHEVMIHRETNECDSSTHGEASSTSHSQRRHSINILDNDSLDHQSYFREHSKTCSISDENANRQTCSEKDKSSRGDRSDSDVSKQRQTKAKLRLSVAGRLEELLSKTNEIMEMERLTRAKTKEERRRSRVAPTGDKGKVSGSARSNNGYEEDVLIGKLKNTSLQYVPTHTGHADSSFIAQEMEKITTSLLGYRDGVYQKGDESQAISPEIAKEYENQKERANAIEQERDHSSAMSGSSYRSVYVPSFSAKTMIANDSIAPGTNENHDKCSPNASNHYDEEEDDDQEEATVQIEVPNGFCGFYQNACFEDVPSSSSNTIKSEKQRITPEQKVGTTNVDVDEPSEPLSEMANTRELNELKCRILNGSNWRNQQGQRKNAHDNSQSPNREDPPMTKSSDAPPLELKNTPEVSAENADIYALPPRVKVNELVARIQGNKHSPLTVNPLDENASDSSEDEIDSAEPVASAKSMNTTSIGGMYVNQNFTTNGGELNQRQTSFRPSFPDYGSQVPPPLSVKTFQHANARQSQFVEPIFIDTRSLIPKDAYFHELPNKNKLRPITDNQPEPPIPSVLVQRQLPNVYNPTARSRNPLPMSVNHNILFHHQPPLITPMAMPNYFPATHQYVSAEQPYQTAAAVIPAGNTAVPVASIQTEYSLIGRPTLPQREKLLANRKFGDADFQKRNYERIDSSTLSIPSAGCNSVGASVHIDHGQQIERDSNNDSGYSTKMGGSSSLGPSPSLSGHTEPEVIIIETRKNDNNYERYGAVDDNGRYYVSTFGASSLV